MEYGAITDHKGDKNGLKWCLINLPMFVTFEHAKVADKLRWHKGSAAAGGTALGKYGPGILAEGVSAAGAPVAASYLGAGATTLAEISSGPLGIGASIIGAISFLTSECECKGK